MSTALAERTETQETDAATSLDLVLPVAPPQQLAHMMRQYEETKKAVLLKSDYQSAEGKDFIKRSGWAKLAVAFGVSTEIRERIIERDEKGTPFRAEFTVRAIAPSGRYADGWGACAVSESRFTRQYDDKGSKPRWKAGDPIRSARQKLEHDLPATAETRARNRACANLFGLGEMTAEEVSLAYPEMDDVVDVTAREIVDEPRPPSRSKGNHVDLTQPPATQDDADWIDTKLNAIITIADSSWPVVWEWATSLIQTQAATMGDLSPGQVVHLRNMIEQQTAGKTRGQVRSLIQQHIDAALGSAPQAGKPAGADNAADQGSMPF